jgi:hypothetical protein
LTASICCLMATLALVGLSAKSSRYTQDNLQSAYGKAVAEQLAVRLSGELAMNDRLGAAGELNRVVQQTSISGARALDVEGVELAVVGHIDSGSVFRANISIAGDVAGIAEVHLNTSAQDAAQLRFQFALSGLALVLSVAVYLATRAMAKRLTKNLTALSAELAAVTGETDANANEVAALRERIAALPLDLLKPQIVGRSPTDHYLDTAILYVYFRSLPGYVDTVDERRLQRYVATVHRLIYGAAGFYNGKLEVVRQFGLAVFFDGGHPVGSPALRAASCAWLIREAAPDIEKPLRLSVGIGLAVGGSELGRGDAKDIYPGLYTQSALDELHIMAKDIGEQIELTDFIAEDLDLTTRMTINADGDQRPSISGVSDHHRDLLERQRRVLLRALIEQQIGDDQSD